MHGSSKQQYETINDRLAGYLRVRKFILEMFRGQPDNHLLELHCEDKGEYTLDHITYTHCLLE